MAPVYESDTVEVHRHANGPRASQKGGSRRYVGGGRSRQAPNERSLVLGGLSRWMPIQSLDGIARLKSDLVGEGIDFHELYERDISSLRALVEAEGCSCDEGQHVTGILQDYFEFRQKQSPVVIHMKGVLEPLGNGDAVLVFLKDNYEIRGLSAFVPACLIEHYQLKRGHVISVRAIPPVEGASCPVVVDIVDVMGVPPAQISLQSDFSDRGSVYSQRRILLDQGASGDAVGLRALDLLAPVGVGQRGLIAGPSRSGKTTLLYSIAKAMAGRHPDSHLIVLLLDERPESISELRTQLKAEIVSSSFGQGSESHVHAAEIVIHRARRLAEQGVDVVLLVDSMTRLVRAYNAVLPGNGRSRILPGGLDVSALNRPKRFFSAGRALRGGGSITLLATLLTGTGSAMDESIYEVFKDAANQVVHLDGVLAKQHIFPALDVELSGTYRDELLYHSDELKKVFAIRKSLLALPCGERIPYLLRRLSSFQSNAELLSNMED